jgi:hypothetical protein
VYPNYSSGAFGFLQFTQVITIGSEMSPVKSVYMMLRRFPSTLVSSMVKFRPSQDKESEPMG